MRTHRRDVYVIGHFHSIYATITVTVSVKTKVPLRIIVYNLETKKKKFIQLHSFCLYGNKIPSDLQKRLRLFCTGAMSTHISCDVSISAFYEHRMMWGRAPVEQPNILVEWKDGGTRCRRS
jgi:hypothetical protein